MKLYPILFEEKSIEPKLTSKTATIDEVRQYFKHFHLSRKFLGAPTFTFTPRAPPEPFHDIEGNVIEDDFTERISLAANIEDAREAIKDYNETYYYVYATQQDKGITDIETNMPNCPKNPPPEYGDKFDMLKWLKKNEPQELERIKKEKASYLAPSKLAPDIKKQFKGCVPDSNETHEKWSLKPLTMIFIGTIGEANNEVQLSKDGASIMGL